MLYWAQPCQCASSPPVVLRHSRSVPSNRHLVRPEITRAQIRRQSPHLPTWASFGKPSSPLHLLHLFHHLASSSESGLSFWTCSTANRVYYSLVRIFAPPFPDRGPESRKNMPFLHNASSHHACEDAMMPHTLTWLHPRTRILHNTLTCIEQFRTVAVNTSYYCYLCGWHDPFPLLLNPPKY